MKKGATTLCPSCRRIIPRRMGKTEDERARICYTEISELVEVQQKLIATMRTLFVELDMEDSRKA